MSDRSEALPLQLSLKSRTATSGGIADVAKSRRKPRDISPISLGELCTRTDAVLVAATTFFGRTPDASATPYVSVTVSRIVYSAGVARSTGGNQTTEAPWPSNVPPSALHAYWRSVTGVSWS